MAEHPELAFYYGNIILVCKVINIHSIFFITISKLLF